MPKKDPPPTKSGEKQARLADALRENLHRRKAQERCKNGDKEDRGGILSNPGQNCSCS